MVLGKLPVSGASYNLDYSRVRAYCACSRCRWGLFTQFYSHLSFLSSFSLSLGDGPIWTEILSQRAVKPKTACMPVNSSYRYFSHLFAEIANAVVVFFVFIVYYSVTF